MIIKECIKSDQTSTANDAGPSCEVNNKFQNAKNDVQCPACPLSSAAGTLCHLAICEALDVLAHAA